MMEGWTEYKLAEIGSFKNGVNFSSDKMGRGISLVNVKDITDSPLLYPDKMDLVDLDIKDRKGEGYLAKEGDIFFVRSSVKRKGVGAVGMLKNNNVPVVHCGFVIRFRLKSKDILPQFAFYLFNTSFNREKVRGISGGATIVNISQGSLKMLKFKFPPLSTQHKIATILSRYDDLIENNLKRIQLLEEKAQLTYEEWFVRMKFPGHESTPINQETGLPEGWEKKKISDLADVKGGKRLPKTHELVNYKTDYPYIRVKDLTSGRISIHDLRFIEKETHDLINIYIISHNDLYISIAGTVGLVGTIPFLLDGANLTENCAKITNIKEFFYKEYICLYLNSQRGQYHIISRTGGASQPKLALSRIKSMPIVVPNNEILHLFHETINTIYLDIENMSLQINLLKEARDILLPRLMTGMIDVEELSVSGLAMKKM